MNTRYLIIAAFTFIFSSSLCGQELRGVELGLTVDNFQGRSETVFAGIYEGASTGLDLGLGEVELPPQPPAEIFDVRMSSTPGKSQLGTGSLSDFRPISPGTEVYTETYTIAYQGGLNATKVNIEWQDPLPGRVTKLVIDGLDMAGKTNVEIPFASGQVTVVVTFNYAPLSFTSNPLTLSFDANDRDPLPSKDVEIIPQGDTKAQWTLSTTDADWITLEPGSGEGRETVTVSINTSQLPPGTYNGVINVRSQVFPARHDIPIVLNFTVGVNHMPVPVGMSLSQNYPNPFIPSTMIDVDLGERLLSGYTPALNVFDVQGRLVMDLSSQVERRTGRQYIQVYSLGLNTGAYRYTLSYGGETISRTLVLIK